MVCHCAVHSLDVADLVPWALWLTSTRDLSTKLIDYLRLQALNNHMYATVSTYGDNLSLHTEIKM